MSADAGGQSESQFEEDSPAEATLWAAAIPRIAKAPSVGSLLGRAFTPELFKAAHGGGGSGGFIHLFVRLIALGATNGLMHVTHHRTPHEHGCVEV